MPINFKVMLICKESELMCCSLHRTTSKQLWKFLFSECSLESIDLNYLAASSTLKNTLYRHKYDDNFIISTLWFIHITYMHNLSSGWTLLATSGFSSISNSTTSGRQWWQDAHRWYTSSKTHHTNTQMRQITHICAICVPSFLQLCIDCVCNLLTVSLQKKSYIFIFVAPCAASRESPPALSVHRPYKHYQQHEVHDAFS